MVQTFIIEESKELIYDSDKISEWKEKCIELGLSEQLKLSEDNKSPIPFENMNEVSKRVYQTLCPAVVEYKKYGKTAIPLEVLGLIKLSEDEKYFDHISIWYDDKSPDPLAVGVVKINDWSQEYFLIARWGDVLRPFDELMKMAIQRYKKKSILDLKNKISEASNKLENIDLNVERYFNADNNSYDVIGF